MDLNWRVEIVEEEIRREQNMGIVENQYHLELALLNTLLKRNDHSPAGVAAFENQLRLTTDAARRVQEKRAKNSPTARLKF